MEKLFYVNDKYEIEEVEKIGQCKDMVNNCEYIWDVFKANGFNKIITLLNTDTKVRCFKDYKTAYLYSFMKFYEKFKKIKIENDEEINKIIEKIDGIKENIKNYWLTLLLFPKGYRNRRVKMSRMGNMNEI